jgi:hypothetical protein
MATNNSNNNQFDNASDGFDLSGGTTKRKLTVTGADVTLTGSGSNVYAMPSSTDTLVGRASTDTLTNKTLTSPVISTIANTGTLTLPTSTDTLVGRATTDTLTNKTITDTSNSVSAKTLTNPIKFSVYRSAALTSSTSETVIAFDTALFDTGSNVDLTTHKGRFTAPVAGFYYFNAGAGNSLATSTIMYCVFYKNGSAVKYGDVRTPTAANNILIVCGLLQLAANDYVEVAYIGGGGSTMKVGSSGCYFDGFLVSTV